mgnify:CR=1 FL=1
MMTSQKHEVEDSRFYHGDSEEDDHEDKFEQLRQKAHKLKMQK